MKKLHERDKNLSNKQKEEQQKNDVLPQSAVADSKCIPI